MAIHPSSSLTKKPEWVVFHELVLTTRNYIRTLTEVRGNWFLEFSPAYFEVEGFPVGEVRRAVEKLWARKQATSKR